MWGGDWGEHVSVGVGAAHFRLFVRVRGLEHDCLSEFFGIFGLSTHSADWLLREEESSPLTVLPEVVMLDEGWRCQRN